MELLPLAIGLGLAVSLLFTELFGLAAGGMVVPGYVALHLGRPLDVALTLAAGVLTWGVVAMLESFVTIYGRRRTVATILVGYLIGAAARALGADGLAGGPGPDGLDLGMVGHIIPGLIALWIARQGLVETLSSLVTASVVVRLLLLALTGAEVLL